MSTKDYLLNTASAGTNAVVSCVISRTLFDLGAELYGGPSFDDLSTHYQTAICLAGTLCIGIVTQKICKVAKDTAINLVESYGERYADQTSIVVTDDDKNKISSILDDLLPSIPIMHTQENSERV